MLEFKKKTRAHKWRNYAVYGLLTLSQLSKTGLELKLVNKFLKKDGVNIFEQLSRVGEKLVGSLTVK